jgi:hypothetical protein
MWRRSVVMLVGDGDDDDDVAAVMVFEKMAISYFLEELANYYVASSSLQ